MFSKSISIQSLVPITHFINLRQTKLESVFQLLQGITKLQIRLLQLVLMVSGELKDRLTVPFLVLKDSVVQQEQSHHAQQANIAEEELVHVQQLLIAQLDSTVQLELSMKFHAQVVLFH